MTLYVVPIVEGPTEVACIQTLLHRVWSNLLGRPERIQVIDPVRAPRDQILDFDGKELIITSKKAVAKLRAKTRACADSQLLVLILIDSEKDGCPATLGPELLKIAKNTIPEDIHVSCVIAKRMLENWIVAGASSLCGVNGLPSTQVRRLRKFWWRRMAGPSNSFC